jgi:hypothetical protein
MNRWKEHASAASVTGACVFAMVTGASAVFAGAWWGQHHGPVVVRYAPGPAGTSRGHAARAGDVPPGAAPQQPAPGAGGSGISAEPESKVRGASAVAPNHPAAAAAAAGRMAKGPVGPVGRVRPVGPTRPTGPGSPSRAAPPTSPVPASPTVAGTGTASAPAGPPTTTAPASPPAPGASRVPSNTNGRAASR